VKEECDKQPNTEVAQVDWMQKDEFYGDFVSDSLQKGAMLEDIPKETAFFKIFDADRTITIRETKNVSGKDPVSPPPFYITACVGSMSGCVCVCERERE
jgi:hypothetical protein